MPHRFGPNGSSERTAHSGRFWPILGLFPVGRRSSWALYVAVEERMSAPTWEAQVDAAKAYEALFVPALFGQWAPKIADAAKIERNHKVLDVACGTGILARKVHSRTGPTGSVLGLDPILDMLAVAHELAPAVNWQQGVAESIPFPDRSFDAVVSQFGLMFFADRHKALREMLRVLTRVVWSWPSGTLLRTYRRTLPRSHSWNDSSARELPKRCAHRLSSGTASISLRCSGPLAPSQPQSQRMRVPLGFRAFG